MLNFLLKHRSSIFPGWLEWINMDPLKRTLLNFCCGETIVEVNSWAGILLPNIWNDAKVSLLKNCLEGCISILIFWQLQRQYTWVDFLKNRWLDAGDYLCHPFILSFNILMIRDCDFNNLICTASAAWSDLHRWVGRTKRSVVEAHGKVAAAAIISQQKSCVDPDDFIER
jgi:hypothetical protein